MGHDEARLGSSARAARGAAVVARRRHRRSRQPNCRRSDRADGRARGTGAAHPDRCGPGAFRRAAGPRAVTAPVGAGGPLRRRMGRQLPALPCARAGGRSTIGPARHGPAAGRRRARTPADRATGTQPGCARRLHRDGRASTSSPLTWRRWTPPSSSPRRASRSITRPSSWPNTLRPACRSSPRPPASWPSGSPTASTPSSCRPTTWTLLAAALRRLRDDPEERARLGKAARAAAEAEWSWDHQVRRVVEALAGVCRPAAPAGRAAADRAAAGS